MTSESSCETGCQDPFYPCSGDNKNWNTWKASDTLFLQSTLPYQLRCAANVRDNKHCVGECGSSLDGIENKVDVLGSTSSVPSLSSDCLRCIDDIDSNQQFCRDFQKVYKCARCRQNVWNASVSPGSYVYTGDLFNEMTEQCCCAGGKPSDETSSPAPQTQPQNSSNGGGGSGLSTNAWIGIGAGAAVIILIIVLFAVFSGKKGSKSNQTESDVEMMSFLL